MAGELQESSSFTGHFNSCILLGFDKVWYFHLHVRDLSFRIVPDQLIHLLLAPDILHMVYLYLHHHNIYTIFHDEHWSIFHVNILHIHLRLKCKIYYYCFLTNTQRYRGGVGGIDTK